MHHSLCHIVFVEWMTWHQNSEMMTIKICNWNCISPRMHIKRTTAEGRSRWRLCTYKACQLSETEDDNWCWWWWWDERTKLTRTLCSLLLSELLALRTSDLTSRIRSPFMNNWYCLTYEGRSWDGIRILMKPRSFGDDIWRLRVCDSWVELIDALLRYVMLFFHIFLNFLHENCFRLFRHHGVTK